MDDEISFRVTDVKQWAYCPRVVYWTCVAPVPRRLPPKVTFGAEDHARLATLEARRSLRDYGLKEGTRRFHVRVASQTLGLRGVLDALLETETERIPVEYKDTLGGVRKNHRLQLTAYAMLLREQPGPPVTRGMLFLIPEDKIVTVPITPALEAEVRSALAAMRAMVEQESFPEPTSQWARCRDCEFFRYCGDRYRPAADPD